jgi:ferredoxin-NADP reductase
VLYKQVTIQQVHQEVRGFKTFVFAEGHNISYQAGQYLTFVHSSRHGEIRRSYSIVSTPSLGEPLTIGVKRIENGAFSRLLIDHACAGDTLMTTGAGGFFILPPDLQSFRQIFFFAAGSGITPVFSLLKAVLHMHPRIHAVLVYSNHSPDQTIFYRQLRELSDLFRDRFILHMIFSNAPLLQRARLNRELLIELLMEYSRAPFDRTLFFICGPEAYMRMCTYTLREEGVAAENIRRENFIAEKKTAPKALPPDKGSHFATIRYAGVEYGLKIVYPDSILQTAKKQGISLPYSCESGRCGSCVAKCIRGKVWHSYNEVLTDKDLEQGLILTCVGHPVGGDIVLEI